MIITKSLSQECPQWKNDFMKLTNVVVVMVMVGNIPIAPSLLRRFSKCGEPFLIYFLLTDFTFFLAPGLKLNLELLRVSLSISSSYEIFCTVVVRREITGST
jgi:hypothetical protein